MVAQIKQGDTCFSEIRYGSANQTRRSRQLHMFLCFRGNWRYLLEKRCGTTHVDDDSYCLCANQTRRSRHMGDHSTCFYEIRNGSANQTRRSRHMGDHSTCFSEIRYGSANQTFRGVEIVGVRSRNRRPFLQDGQTRPFPGAGYAQ